MFNKKAGINELTNPQTFINNADDNQSDRISLMAIQELLNHKKLKAISRLKIEQVSHIAKLYLFSDTFGNKFAKSLADNILNLQISINGLGRKELVNLVQRRNDMLEVAQTPIRKDVFR